MIDRPDEGAYERSTIVLREAAEWYGLIPDRWVVHRGYGVRDNDTGATLWCHTREQEQSTELARWLADTLNKAGTE